MNYNLVGDSNVVSVASQVFLFDDLESLGQRSVHAILLKDLIGDSLYEVKLDWVGY